MKPRRGWAAPDANAGKSWEISAIVVLVIFSAVALVLHYLKYPIPGYFTEVGIFLSALMALAIWHRQRLHNRYNVTQDLLALFEPVTPDKDAFASQPKDTFPSLPQDLIRGDYDAPREVARSILGLPCFARTTCWYANVPIRVLETIKWILRILVRFLGILLTKLRCRIANKRVSAARVWLIKASGRITRLSLRLERYLTVVTIGGPPVCGKSTLIERLAVIVSQMPGSEVWFQRRDTELSSGNWRKLVEAIKAYANHNKGRRLIFCFDEPFDKMPSATKDELDFHHPSDVWTQLGNDLKKHADIVLMVTWNHIHSGRELPFYLTVAEQVDDEEPLEDRNDPHREPDFKVFGFALNLTLEDMKRLLEKVAGQLGYDKTVVNEFLDSPGNLWSSRRNFLYLIYLFERFYAERMGLTTLQANSKTESLVRDLRLSKLRSMLHTRNSLLLFDKYCRLEAPDRKRYAILFTSFANLISLPVPDNVLKCGLEQQDIDFLSKEGYLVQDANHDWHIKDIFLSYVLLQEEFGQSAEFADTIEGIMLPWVSPLCDSLRTGLRRLNDSIFLRDFLHFVAEERYKPILSGYGREAALRLFRKQQEKIQFYIYRTLVKEIDTDLSPLPVWEIRRWASSFQRFGFDEEALRLLNLILGKVDSIRITKLGKARILIPVANALIRFRSETVREEGKKLYSRLMGEEFVDVRGIDRLSLLDEALTSLINVRDDRTALRWMDETPVRWQHDARMWMNRARVLENLGSFDDANACYIASLQKSTRIRETKPHYFFQVQQRYALFLVRHASRINHSTRLPDPLALLAEAETVAKSTGQTQYLPAVYSTRGQLYQRRGDYGLALESHRRSVESCKKTGTPNPRPHLQLANFLMEHAEPVAKATGETIDTYLAEAERELKVVAMGEDFDGMSRMRCYNSLGRLVACIIFKSQSDIRYVADDGRARPDYEEALRLLENSFESDEDARFDPRTKRWQDIVTHGPVKDVLIRLALSLSGRQRKAYLQEAETHFRATFEGLPNSHLDDQQVREHVVWALVAYADFVWERLGKEGIIAEAESVKNAEEYYTQAIKRLEEWNLNSSRFPASSEIYSFYARFLWQTQVKKRQPVAHPDMSGSTALTNKAGRWPALPLDAESEDAMLKIVDCNDKCLSILDSRNYILDKALCDTVRSKLLNLRTLTESAVLKEDSEQAEAWIIGFLELISKSLGEYKINRKELLPTLNSFVNHPRVVRFLETREILRSRIRSIYSS